MTNPKESLAAAVELSKDATELLEEEEEECACHLYYIKVKIGNL